MLEKVKAFPGGQKTGGGGFAEELVGVHVIGTERMWPGCLSVTFIPVVKLRKKRYEKVFTNSGSVTGESDFIVSPSVFVVSLTFLQTLERMYENRSVIGRVLLTGLAFVLAMILIAFIFRSPFASWLVNRQIARFNQQHHARLSIDRIRIRGLAAVQMEGLSLAPEYGDTLVSVDTIFVSVGILKLFAGRISIHQVFLVNPKLTMTDRGGDRKSVV